MATPGQFCAQLLLILGMDRTCLNGANDVMIMKETAGRRQRLMGLICASGPDWGCFKG